MKYENLNINGLFLSIDTIKNSFEENQKIFDNINLSIKNKIKKYYNDYLKKREKKEMLKRYRRYLSELSDLVNLQIKQIDDILNNDTKFDFDFDSIYSQMKSELFDACTYQLDLEVSDINTAMEDDNEKKIFYYNYCYNLMTNYMNNHKTPKIKYIKTNNYTNDLLHNIQSEFFLIITLKNNIYKDNTNLYEHKLHILSSNNSQNALIDEQQTKAITLELYKEYYISQFQSNFSKAIYYQRNKKNLTQKELAERSDVDRTMIAKIEKVNQKTTMETAVKLLTSLDLGIMFYPLK